jgi:alkaline phosphatase D
VRIGRVWAFAGDPFALSVASGSPGPDSVVLLATDPDRPGGMPREPVAVRWEVGLDDRLSQIVRNGEAAAMPEYAHAVHVECAGLKPGHDYWYRFVVGGEASPIGRTRTAPARGAALDQLRFAFCSCSNYELSYFSAYRYLAGEHADLVVFLGDYIYEYVSQSPHEVQNDYADRWSQTFDDPQAFLMRRAAAYRAY